MKVSGSENRTGWRAVEDRAYIEGRGREVGDRGLGGSRRGMVEVVRKGCALDLKEKKFGK